MYGPTFLLNARHNLGQLFPSSCNHFHKEGGCINAILAVDMPMDGKSPGGFPAKDRPRFLHFGRDMLKTYRHLIALLPKLLGYLVQHMGSGNIPYHRAAPSLVFHEVIVEQHQDVVGMEEIPFIVNDPNPVRIPVRGNPNVKSLFHYKVLQGMEGGRGRRRELAAKERVMPVVDRCHLAAGSH